MIAVMFMGSTLLTPLYVLYQQVFAFSDITLTVVYAAYVIGNLTALLFFGKVSDRNGRRPTVLAAMAVAMLSSLLFVFALGTIWLFVGRMISGFGVGVAAGAGTAWLAELEGDRAWAARLATGGNFVGLAAGALMAGLLSQYAPWPLELSQVVYLAMLAAIAALVGRTAETVTRRDGLLSAVSLKPRLGVPAELRAPFIGPAASAFATFGFVGFYVALLPSILAHGLGQKNHAVAGAIVGLAFVVSTITLAAARRLSSRAAMLSSLAILPVGVALLVLAQFLASMPVLLAATVLAGITIALGYRGGLEVVNRIAPDDRRAELVSTYLLICFAGNALPVLGVGLLTTMWGSLAADLVFAAFTAAIALAALVAGYRAIPRQ